ncbi:MAG: hypothetical protein QNJ47_00720 [Nostocaceae cyanobacterium]|nr:hypothetical protein [Nostocaceae cyanobacterium]
MANIKVNELSAAGAELLFDSESFLNELSNDEISSMMGGMGSYRICPESIYCTPGDNSFCCTLFDC